MNFSYFNLSKFVILSYGNPRKFNRHIYKKEQNVRDPARNTPICAFRDLERAPASASSSTATVIKVRGPSKKYSYAVGDPERTLHFSMSIFACPWTLWETHICTSRDPEAALYLALALRRTAIPWSQQETCLVVSIEVSQPTFDWRSRNEPVAHLQLLPDTVHG